MRRACKSSGDSIGKKAATTVPPTTHWHSGWHPCMVNFGFCLGFKNKGANKQEMTRYFIALILSLGSVAYAIDHAGNALLRGSLPDGKMLARFADVSEGADMDSELGKEHLFKLLTQGSEGKTFKPRSLVIDTKSGKVTVSKTDTFFNSVASLVRSSGEKLSGKVTRLNAIVEFSVDV
jgi:hypothetical protein